MTPQAVFAFLLLISPTALAELSLPPHLASHMVVQANAPIAIHGQSDPGEQVEVSFAGERVSSTADEHGFFRVVLSSHPASAESREVIIRSKDEEVVLSDVLVGEVWFCSGQSNMVWRMRSSDKFEEFKADANRPTIRTFNAHNVAAEEPRN